MSKSKSLGSSPIGYSSSGNSRYNFIPDLGVSEKEKETEEQHGAAEPEISGNEGKKLTSEKIHKLFSSTSRKPANERKPEKKIASYSLDINLINNLKAIADRYNIYYSGFVSDAIKHWIDAHNYEDR